MALKKFRPITPGQRHKVALTFDEITTSKPEKSLLAKKKRSGGRNDTGKMTIENIGGGHKQRYRIIDFKEKNLVLLLKYLLLSMIQIELQILLYYTILMVKKGT
jgi:ribosomal protein L2